jgi:hypothetical protein
MTLSSIHPNKLVTRTVLATWSVFNATEESLSQAVQITPLLVLQQTL